MAQQPMTVTGIVGTDPHYHQTAEDNGVCRFRVGASRSKKDEEGNWVNYDQVWFTVEAWGQLAENSRRSLAKGMSVIVVGIPITVTWTDKEGNSRSQVALRASHIGPDLNRYLTNTIAPTHAIVTAAPGQALPGGETMDRSWIDTSSLSDAGSDSSETSTDMGSSSGEDSMPPF